MAEREKVIRGLEWCIKLDGNGCSLECPYLAGKSPCPNAMLRDALALLREQEARVVTTADFENNPNLDDGGHLNVWEEYKSGARFGWNTINVNDVRAFTDLRRYWTSRPTEEQRKAVPWDAEP